MVCDRRILVATTQSVFQAANPVGALVGGILTDKYMFNSARAYTFFPFSLNCEKQVIVFHNFIF